MIAPTSDRVIVLPDNPREMTHTGIIIPVDARERSQTGTVQAFGPGKGGEPMDSRFEAGARVIFTKTAGTKINIDEIDYLIMREADVWGFLPPQQINES